MKFSIKNSLRSRSVKYGGYATLFSAAVLATLVVVNLIVQQVPAQIDLSGNKLFTLSEQTKNVIDSIEQPITIYGLFSVGNEPAELLEVMRRYEASSSKISLKLVDPDTNPGFAAKYAPDEGGSLRAGSLVIESGPRWKAIDYLDLLNVSYQDPYNPQVQSYAFEQRITNALMFVATGRTPKIYQVAGHREYTLDALGLTQMVENENYTIESLNLITAPAVPEDAELLFVLSPKQDFTEDEAEKLRAYLERAGHVLFLLDFLPGSELPVLSGLLESYGVRYGHNAIVMEGDPERYYRSQYGANPFWIFPQFETHDITGPLVTDDQVVLMPEVVPIERADLVRRTLEVTPLLVTSRNSWVRTDFNSSSMERIPSDRIGPIPIAVAVSEQPTYLDDRTLKLVAIGNSQFLSPQLNMQMIPGNTNFFMNAVSWTADRTESISIRPKSLFVFPMRLTGPQVLIFAGLFTVLIPLVILATGLVVWLRRRHL